MSYKDDIKDVRELSNTEILENIVQLKRELFNLRFQRINKQLGNSARFRVIRCQIARRYTVLRERELIKSEKLEEKENN